MNKKFKLNGVSFIHDSNAAQKWSELYIEIIKDNLLRKASIILEGEHNNEINEIEGD
ncbi:hypothetical protein [Paenibacillus odorifer]|jgi:hypothetical protein|uniref:hypothetical protein n=1 Tax=Paenibacillus odorifer TaxID=189426 RepID=UPI001482928D|nr:hypothetical protein [Paenibacillus odorifer]